MVSDTRDRLLASALAACFLLSGPPTVAEGAEADRPVAEPPSPAPVAAPVYVPPTRGAPRGKVSGGQRGVGQLPDVTTLAPEHLAHTIAGSPTFYWYVSATPPEGSRFTFTLLNESADSIDLDVERALPPPRGPGVQAIDLIALGIELEPEAEYQWIVALISDPDKRANDVLANGYVRRITPPAALDPAPDAASYAAEGLWYDAVHALESRIAKRPDDRVLRLHRDALLRSGGVHLASP